MNDFVVEINTEAELRIFSDHRFRGPSLVNHFLGSRQSGPTRDRVWRVEPVILA